MSFFIHDPLVNSLFAMKHKTKTRKVSVAIPFLSPALAKELLNIETSEIQFCSELCLELLGFGFDSLPNNYSSQLEKARGCAVSIDLELSEFIFRKVVSCFPKLVFRLTMSPAHAS